MLSCTRILPLLAHPMMERDFPLSSKGSFDRLEMEFETPVPVAEFVNQPGGIIPSVEDLVTQITLQPEKIGEVLKGINDNPKMMMDVMGRFQSHPQLKEEIARRVAGDKRLVAMTAKAMKGQSAMKKKREAKEAQRKLAPAIQVIGVRLTQNGQSKRYVLSSMFPAGTIFEGGDCVGIGDDVIMYSGHSSNRKNDLASTIAGDTVFGEAVIIREAEDGKLVDFTLDHYKETFRKGIRAASA